MIAGFDAPQTAAVKISLDQHCHNLTIMLASGWYLLYFDVVGPRRVDAARRPSNSTEDMETLYTKTWRQTVVQVYCKHTSALPLATPSTIAFRPSLLSEGEKRLPMGLYEMAALLGAAASAEEVMPRLERKPEDTRWCPDLGGGGGPP